MLVVLAVMLSTSHLFTLDTVHPTSERDIWIKAHRTPHIQKPQVLGSLAVYNEISKYDWDLREAEIIANCESGGNPRAINWEDSHRNCSGSFGLFQLACLYGTQEELLNIEVNVKRAYELYKRNGGFRRDWVICSKLL